MIGNDDGIRSAICRDPRVFPVAHTFEDQLSPGIRYNKGDVVIEFTGESREGYRPFELVFRLPDGATVAP